MKYIGAHVKREKTVIETIDSVIRCNGNALQLFVSNPISAQLVDLERYLHQDISHHCEQNNFKLVIHAPYLINLAMEPKNSKRIIDLDDCYWIKALINQLMVSDIIGSVGVVVHVGKYTKSKPEDGLKRMHSAISHVVKAMKDMGLASKLIIETPAGAGTELLCNVESFTGFYNSFTKQERKHLGVCLDTAHVWSSGYNINDYYRAMGDSVNDITVIHLNNSKKKKGSMADAHDVIQGGNIPVDDVREFIKKVRGDPIIILETPSANLDEDIEFVRQNLCKAKRTSCGTA